MTSAYIVMALLALIALFTWLSIRAYNRDKWEREDTKQKQEQTEQRNKRQDERTKRLSKWFEFRKWRRENGGLFGWRKNKHWKRASELEDGKEN